MKAFFSVLFGAWTAFSGSAFAVDIGDASQIRGSDILSIYVDSAPALRGGQVMTVEVESAQGVIYSKSYPAIVGGRAAVGLTSPAYLLKDVYGWNRKIAPFPYVIQYYNMEVLDGDYHMIAGDQTIDWNDPAHLENGLWDLSDNHVKVPPEAARSAMELIRKVGVRNSVIVTGAGVSP